MSTISAQSVADRAFAPRAAVGLRAEAGFEDRLTQRLCVASRRRNCCSPKVTRRLTSTARNRRNRTLHILNDADARSLALLSWRLARLGIKREHDMTPRPQADACALPVAASLRRPRRRIRRWRSSLRGSGGGLAATRDPSSTGQRSALERVAGFLLAFSRRNDAWPRSGSLELPNSDRHRRPSRLTIETVSRTLTKLRSLRVIELPRCHEVPCATSMRWSAWRRAPARKQPPSQAI